MKRLTVVLALAACGGNGNHHGSDAAIDSHTVDSRPIDAPADARPLDAPPDSSIVIVDAPVLDAPPAVCNPLTQTGCNTGEKCTWIVDAVSPQYVGHIGCAPDGAVAVDAACTYGAPGATGYDNCTAGLVCSGYAQAGSGTCKAICDNQGGNPMCDATHACVTYSGLFSTGTASPAAAGVCDLACNPLDDNDFDGSGSALSRVGTTCGSASIGCYGYPSFGSPPATAWSCTTDLHYGTPLQHRTACDSTTGCTDTSGTLYVNACNQGYLPLFYDQTGSTQVDCIAMCKPIDCYAGNCGSNDVNRIGAAPHRCSTPDALGNFGSDENCEYLWSEELDSTNNWLPSANSNTVGFCFDHSKYKYDPTGGNNPTIAYPSCEQLQLTATGTDPNDPLTYFSAVDFGCVSTTTAGVMFSGKVTRHHIDRPRGAYHRAMR